MPPVRNADRAGGFHESQLVLLPELPTTSEAGERHPSPGSSPQYLTQAEQLPATQARLDQIVADVADEIQREH